MVWDHVDFDSVHLEYRLARRAHRGDDDALVQSADEFAFKADTPRDLEEVTELHLAGDGESVNPSFDKAIDEPLKSRRIFGEEPAV
jgi:hypothetical protein